jgi:hypothetical protein
MVCGITRGGLETPMRRMNALCVVVDCAPGGTSLARSWLREWVLMQSSSEFAEWEKLLELDAADFELGEDEEGRFVLFSEDGSTVRIAAHPSAPDLGTRAADGHLQGRSDDPG